MRPQLTVRTYPGPVRTPSFRVITVATKGLVVGFTNWYCMNAGAEVGWPGRNGDQRVTENFAYYRRILREWFWLGGRSIRVGWFVPHGSICVEP